MVLMVLVLSEGGFNREVKTVNGLGFGGVFDSVSPGCLLSSIHCDSYEE